MVVGDVFEGAARSAIGNLSAAHPEKVKVDESKIFVGLDAFQKVIDSGVDVVLLATPPGFRPQHFRYAVEQGKHCFCEKPVAVDAPGVRSVLESARIAKDKGLSVVSGFCWRYSKSRREGFERLHAGEVGEITSMLATYHTGPVKPHPDESSRPAGISDVEWQVRNWYNWGWLSGDSLVEQAVHSVDKIAWAMGDQPPVACVATGGRQIPARGGNIYDHFHVAYEYPNQVWAHLASRQIPGCHGENNDYIRCSGGSMVIGGGAPYLADGEGQRVWQFRGDEPNMYQVEHDELFEGIRSGKPVNDGEWMAHSSLLAIMGRMAAYTGQRVTWEAALNSEWDLAPDDLGWEDSFEPDPMALPGVMAMR